MEGRWGARGPFFKALLNRPQQAEQPSAETEDEPVYVRSLRPSLTGKGQTRMRAADYIQTPVAARSPVISQGNSAVESKAHNLVVAGSIPAPATRYYNHYDRVKPLIRLSVGLTYGAPKESSRLSMRVQKWLTGGESPK